MKYFYFLFLIAFFNQSYANSVSCEFEEVYQDGSIQTGYMLFSDGLLRYQYSDKQLFTIIYNSNCTVITIYTCYFAVTGTPSELTNGCSANAR